MVVNEIYTFHLTWQQEKKKQINTWQKHTIKAVNREFVLFFLIPRKTFLIAHIFTFAAMLKSHTFIVIF